MGRFLLLAALAAGQVLSPALADDATLRLAFTSSFGGLQAGQPYRLSFGLTAPAADELLPQGGQRFIPVTGMSYLPGQGISPVVLGNVAASSGAARSAAGASSGPWYTQWGWVAAMSAVLVGAVVVAADSSDEDPGEGDPDEPGDGGCQFVGGTYNVTDPMSSEPVILGPDCGF